MTASFCEHCGGKVNEHGLAPLEEDLDADALEESTEPPPDDAVEKLFNKALSDIGAE